MGGGGVGGDGGGGDGGIGDGGGGDGGIGGGIGGGGASLTPENVAFTTLKAWEASPMVGPTSRR